MAFRPLPARAPAAMLREAKPLKALFSAAQRLTQLQRLLESQLQPAAREYCHLASWREGCLLLIVTDGNWATRLRYQQRRLLRQLQQIDEFAGLQRILFKVQPPTSQTGTPNRSIELSSCAAESIQTTADGISDPGLRAALERLASHGKKNRQQQLVVSTKFTDKKRPPMGGLNKEIKQGLTYTAATGRM